MMNIIAKESRDCDNRLARKSYKASFVTKEGVVHRVDFDEEGRIDNLCVYTSFSPNILLSDLEILIDKIKQTITK